MSQVCWMSSQSWMSSQHKMQAPGLLQGQRQLLTTMARSTRASLGFWLCFQGSQRDLPWAELSPCGHRLAGCASSPWEWAPALMGQWRSLSLAITFHQGNHWC